jgi:large subunit ribosomal protein L24
MPRKIRKGDTVKVLHGRDRGKTGKVMKLLDDKDKKRALVEQINIMKKHSKPTQKVPQGGIIEKEASVDMSNLMLMCGRCHKATRPKVKKLENASRVRICRHCGEII